MRKKKVDIKDPQYKKYKGVYTKYAIYIDNHIPDIAVPYQNPEVETNIYNYTKAICYVLAYKDNYFHDKFENYEPFSLYAASELYMIFRDRYNNQGQIKRGKKVEPIKSSLNFIKKTLYALKVEYSKKYFYQVFKSEWGEEDENKNRKELEEKKRVAVENYTKSSVIREYDPQLVEATIKIFNMLPSIIKEILNNSPYSKDKITFNRLYKTCLLSLLNNITLPNSKKNVANLSWNQFLKRYNKERDNCIILWHLEESFSPYVKILLTRIRECMIKEIEETISYMSLDETTVKNILSTAYNTYDTDQNSEE